MDGISKGAEILRLRVPANPQYAPIVRERLLRFTAERSIAAEDVEEFVTAVGEALANAIEHADSKDPIELEVRLEGANLVLATIADHGRGVAPGRFCAELPPVAAERGRGIPLMRRYSDLFSMQSDPISGTRVMLGRFVAARGGAN